MIGALPDLMVYCPGKAIVGVNFQGPFCMDASHGGLTTLEVKAGQIAMALTVVGVGCQNFSHFCNGPTVVTIALKFLGPL
jgi:hypothetical protein